MVHPEGFEPSPAVLETACSTIELQVRILAYKSMAKLTSPQQCRECRPGGVVKIARFQVPLNPSSSYITTCVLKLHGHVCDSGLDDLQVWVQAPVAQPIGVEYFRHVADS